MKRPERRRSRSTFYDHYDSLDPGMNFRKHAELYRVGRGEQGVLMVEPYKSELLPLWRFATVPAAKTSSRKLLQRFKAYLKAGDFVGADMARKFLQMGYTRARRYANHKSGKKYDAAGQELPRGKDATKSAAADIFHDAWARVRSNERYLKLKQAHQAQYG